jgi:hypothetical protein
MDLILNLEPVNEIAYALREYKEYIKDNYKRIPY